MLYNSPTGCGHCQKKWLCLGALLGALIGLISFVPIYMHFKGQLVDYGDYYLQMVPFIRELRRMILSGNLSWSWNSFLGDSFVSAYSYYTVFNPFAWLVALFPDQYLLYGTMFATIVKLSVSMVGAMLYMSVFCRKDSLAMIGALLYTFSGFTIVNTTFYFFLDVIAVFPYLMFGLEKLIRENKRSTYLVMLMINAAINYYCFVATVLLVVLYVLFRLRLYCLSSWKENWSVFVRVAIWSVIGTGLAGFALLPSFFAIMGSGKASETIGTEIQLMYWPQNILERMRTLVAPIESGRYHAFYDSSAWSSTGCYLPVFGSVFVIQWGLQKKDWIGKLILTLVICYFVPFLNAAFNLFSSADYTRWLYGLVLLGALATTLMLEEIAEQKQIPSKKIAGAVSAGAGGLLVVPAVVYALYRNGISAVNRFASACTMELFMGYHNLLIMLVLTAVNYWILWYLVCKKCRIRQIGFCLILTSILNYTTYNWINYDLHPTAYSNAYYYEKSFVEGTSGDSNEFEYRIDHPGQIANYSLFKNRPAVNYYNSLQNPGSSAFAAAVGIGENQKDTVLINSDTDSAATDALLSVRYYYDYDGNTQIPDGFRYAYSENGVDIYGNTLYIPMGFTYEYYCTEQQLEKLSKEDRARVMLDTLVVDEEKESRADDFLRHRDKPTAQENLAEAVEGRRSLTCNEFTGTSSGFTAEIDLPKDDIVFFSIPFDSGWNITVNEEPAETMEVQYGLTGILCPKGHNEVAAVYHTNGLGMGIGCTALCMAVWILTVLKEKRYCKEMLRGKLRRS